MQHFQIHKPQLPLSNVLNADRTSHFILGSCGVDYVILFFFFFFLLCCVVFKFGHAEFVPRFGQSSCLFDGECKNSKKKRRRIPPICTIIPLALWTLQKKKVIVSFFLICFTVFHFMLHGFGRHAEFIPELSQCQCTMLCVCRKIEEDLQENEERKITSTTFNNHTTSSKNTSKNKSKSQYYIFNYRLSRVIF